MYLSANSHAKAMQQAAAMKKKKDDALKKKMEESSAKYKRTDLSENGSTDNSSGATADASSRSLGLDGGPSMEIRVSERTTSGAWDTEHFSSITTEERRKMAAITYVEGRLKTQEKKLDGFPVRFEHAKMVLSARLSSKNTIATKLSINEYKRIEADKESTERTISSLEDFLSEIVEGKDPSLHKAYKEKTEAILGAAPIQADSLPVSAGSDSQLVEDELARIGIE